MKKNDWLVRLILSLLVILVYFLVWHGRMFETIDSDLYLKTARELITGGSGQLPDRTWGYPILLILSGFPGSHESSLLLIQLAMHALSVNFLLLTLRRIGLSLKMSWLIFFFGFMPLYVNAAGLVMTEILSEFLLALSVFLLITSFKSGRDWIWILTGVLLALAAITRPTYQMIVPALLAGLLLFHQYLGISLQRLAKLSFLIFLPFAIILGTVIAYNGLTYHYTGLTPNLGYNLCTKTSSVFEDIPAGWYPEVKKILIEERDSEFVHRYSRSGETGIWAALPRIQRATGRSYSDFSHEMMKMNLYLITAKPYEYSMAVSSAFSRYLLPYYDQPIQWGRGALVFHMLIHLIVIGTFFSAAVYYLYRFGRLWLTSQSLEIEVRHIFIYVAGCIILYTAFISCLVETGAARFRYPTDLLILSMSALFADTLQKTVARKRALNKIVG